MSLRSLRALLERAHPTIARARSVLRGLIDGAYGRIKRRPVLTAVVALLVAAIAITIPRPGAVVILHRDTVAETDLPLARTLVRESLSVARARRALAHVIAERLGSDNAFLAESNEALWPDRLDALIDAELEIETDKAAKFHLKVRLVALLQAYVDRFLGGDATYVVIDTFVADE